MTLAILGTLLLLIFGSFGMATSLFQDTDVRQSAENQLRGIKLLLQRDLELSDFWLNNSLERSTPDGWRDALSVSALGDWDNPANFDGASDRPLWNRYVVWYATQEPDARLYRQVVEPGGLITVPYAGLSTNLSDLNPDGNANALYTRLMSNRVRNFQVTSRLQNGTVRVGLRLRAEGSRRPNTATRTVENLELVMTFHPRNTFPKI